MFAYPNKKPPHFCGGFGLNNQPWLAFYSLLPAMTTITRSLPFTRLKA